MKSEIDRSTEIAIELTVNSLRAMAGRVWITGEIPVGDGALEDPEGLIHKVRNAAELAGFGWVQLDLLPGANHIRINGTKDQALK